MTKFKTPQGVFLLKALFFETNGSADKSTVLYTLKDEPHEGYPSLYQAYMEMEDPTEWRFANEYLASYQHWKALCECKWFLPYLERWRDELDLKLKGRALLEIQACASDPDRKNSYNANRFLVEGGWKDKTSPRGRGRPRKEEKEAVKASASRLQEDLERITKING